MSYPKVNYKKSIEARLAHFDDVIEVKCLKMQLHQIINGLISQMH